MIEIITNVVGPVAVLVLIGALTGTRLGIEAGQLSRLAYWVLGPAFMFDALARAELASSLILRLTVASLVGMAAATAFTWAAAKTLGVSGSEAGAMILSSAYGNVGNAGLAISIFALGETIKPAASVIMLVVNTVGIVVGVSLASSRTGGYGLAIGRALRAPMALAAFAAIAFNYANTVTTIELPVLADRVVSILAGALIPMMLYTLGVQLVGQGRPRLGSSIAVVSAAKLLTAPLAVAAFAGLIGLEGDFAKVAIIQSAMPPAVFTAVVALEHAYEVERVTTYLVGTSLVSVVTLPVVLALI